MQSIEAYLRSKRQHFLEILTPYVKRNFREYQDIYPAFTELLGHLEIAIITGGKFGRATLSHLGYLLVGGKPTQAATMSMLASEIFHRFILIHDDIIDRDQTRHGLPTIEALYTGSYQKRFGGNDQAPGFGQAMAIVAGDLVHSLSHQLILDSGLSPVIANQAISSLNRTTFYTVAGWQLETDLKQLPLSAIQEPEVIKAMTLVSAHYSVLRPLQFGQIIAGFSPNQFDPSLETYGTSVGLGFQIQDDIMAIFGDPSVTGKPVGNDIRENKKSLLLLKTYQHLQVKEAKWLENLMGKPISASDLEKLQQLIKQRGVLDSVKKIAQDYIKKGITALDQSKHAAKPEAELLRQLAGFLANRSH